MQGEIIEQLSVGQSEEKQIMNKNKSSKYRYKPYIKILSLITILTSFVLVIYLLLHNNFNQNVLFIEKKKYRYSIGLRPLVKNSKANLTHTSFLLGNDTFEYLEPIDEGFNDFSEVSDTNQIFHGGVNRFRNRGKDPNFDWNEIGIYYSGETTISPSELDKIIKISNKWGAYDYNFMFHNCHDFAKFCLESVGFDKSKIRKKGPILY